MNTHNISLGQKNGYSLALFELAEECNSIKEIESQVNAILKLILECKEFNSFLKNPISKQDEQKNIILEISKNFGINNLLSKFLNYIVFKRRLFFLEKILSDFINICSHKRGEIQATIKTAKKLSPNEIENIKIQLKDKFGSNIKLIYKFDPSLIGGLIIQIGSIMIDTSIKNKLQKIENRLIEA